MNLTTPYYLIHERKILRNLKIIESIRKQSGTKFVLALKCFSTWSVFGLIRKYLDGTTSSSLYEAKLGRDKFKKEVQAYSVAFREAEVKEVVKIADKIIFNSLAQLKKFHKYTKNLKVGLRVNPKISYSQFDLADPASKYSRLGLTSKSQLSKALGLINGIMFHFNCENDSFKNFSANLNKIASSYGNLLKKLDWVSLGGGLYFTKPGYPIKDFAGKLKDFSDKFKIQVYLEPGESVIANSGELVTRVLDIVHNQVDIAIVDSSTEAHMLDLLVYRSQAKIKTPSKGKFKYMVAGRSCLAGDIFGSYNFKKRLRIGQIIRIAHAAGYTMVKKNWFNGLKMPSIAIKRLNGSIDLIRKFSYKDFLNNLS